MNLADRIKNVFKPKVFDPATSIDLQNVVGWRSLGGSTAYGYYKDNQYENGYPSISKLSNGFAQIEPTTIDKTGKSVPSNVLDRLFTPNTDMSAFDFREALAVCFLVHDKVRLRVHYRNTRLNAETITGFTFMEDYSETVVGGQRHYKMRNGDDLTDEEVITLKSVNPESVTDGFSASRAARRWTRLDDYIADYQKGFFENGAIPQGQLIITARTKTEYNDIVDVLQARHKGAGKNNNVTYTYRPTDQNGSPLNATIEWVPFSSENKNMGLKEIFQQVNQKIDSVYGVPASIRGVNDANTYASVRVDELIFVKYALSPMTLKIWSKFTHELNRVTGGAGVAITYELEVPKLADEEKITAEAKSIDAATVTNLVAQGFSLQSAVEYINTGELAALDKPIPPVDKPEVLSSEDAKDTPEQPIDAFAKSFYKDMAEIKALLTVQPKVGTPIVRPVKYQKKVISPEDRQNYEQELSAVIKNRMEIQIDKVIDTLDLTKAISEDEPIEDVEDELLSAEMLAVLYGLVSLQGEIEHKNNAEIVFEAGISIDNIAPFKLTAGQRAQYSAYINKVAAGYNDETSEKIRQILTNGRINGLPAQQIKDDLSEILAEEWRIKRLAVSEINRAGNNASLYSMQEIAEQTGATVEKVWEHGGTDSPCEFCAAMIGRTVPIDENFVELDGEVIGTSGGLFVNDFVPIDVAELHPNGHCRQGYRIRREQS